MQSKCTLVFGGFVHRSCSLVYRMRGGPRIQVSYNQQKTRRRMKWSKKPSCSGSALGTPHSGPGPVLHISCFLVTCTAPPANPEYNISLSKRHKSFYEIYLFSLVTSHRYLLLRHMDICICIIYLLNITQ